MTKDRCYKGRAIRNQKPDGALDGNEGTKKPTWSEVTRKKPNSAANVNTEAKEKVKTTRRSRPPAIMVDVSKEEFFGAGSKNQEGCK